MEAIRTGIRNYAEHVGVPDFNPPIVCIIACKRHNKRFAIDTGRNRFFVIILL